MFKLILFTFLCCHTVFGQDVKISTDPNAVVKNQEFEIVFEIKTENSDKPEISFLPHDLKILSKSNLGTSLQTTFINGRFTSSRRVKIAYQAIAEKAGISYLKDIEIKTGNQKKELGNFQIRVFAKAKSPRKFFLEAEVSKESVFVNEGFDVNYYLYYRVPVVESEVSEFPKLNGFYKRFKLTKDSVETVNRDGVVYRRIKKYSARLFAEKAGKLKIDPLKLRVRYSNRDASSFGMFRLSMGPSNIKNVQSKQLDIEIKNFPSENVPKGFTGLVGKHEMSVRVPRNRFVVNEAVEASMEFVGPGALETLSAPEIYNLPQFEKFDTKSEMAELDALNSKKIFNYTFLARGGVKVEEKEETLYYLDPETGEYKPMPFVLPGVEIVGGVASSVAKTVAPVNRDANKVRTDSAPMSKEYLAPLFISSSFVNLFGVRQAYVFLVAIMIISIFLTVFFKLKTFRKVSHFDKALKDIAKQGLTYKNLFRLLNYSGGEIKGSLREWVEDQGFSDSVRNELKEIIKKIETHEFNQGEKYRLSFSRDAVKELKRNYLKGAN